MWATELYAKATRKRSILDILSFMELENLDLLIISEENEPKRLPRNLNCQHWLRISPFKGRELKEKQNKTYPLEDLRSFYALRKILKTILPGGKKKLGCSWMLPADAMFYSSLTKRVDEPCFNTRLIVELNMLFFPTINYFRPLGSLFRRSQRMIMISVFLQDKDSENFLFCFSEEKKPLA